MLLAEEAAQTLEEARRYYQAGVEAGERALGPSAFEEYAGHFWGVLETRPYMRARAGLAQVLWMMDKRQEAIEHLKELLQLNPNDNQGLRYVLLGYLLKVGADKAIKDLLDQYEGDLSASWTYSLALWTFRQKGASRDAAARLKEAIARNRFVPAYLLGRKKFPQRLPEYIGIGDVNEAINYAFDSKSLWEETPGAIDWLRGGGSDHEIACRRLIAHHCSWGDGT